MKNLLFLLSNLLIVSGCCMSGVNQTLELAGENAHELRKVLNSFSHNDTLSQAATFLVAGMRNKYSYDEKLIACYDPYFQMLTNWKALGLHGERDPFLTALWDSLSYKDSITFRSEKKVLDCQYITADLLENNIQTAYQAWMRRPNYTSDNFNDFLEFVLPYKVASEMPKSYRNEYLLNYSILKDTATSPRNFLIAFKTEFYHSHGGRVRGNILTFPYDIPIDRFQLGLMGDCHQNSIFCTSVMRALGIPVAVDLVQSWGNRSSGHEWCCIILKNNRFYPFCPFDIDSALLEYKPAKILRRIYSVPDGPQPDSSDVPSHLMDVQFKDVTNLYGQTFHVDIPVKYNIGLRNYKRFAIICVFDNQGWHPIWYGKNENGRMWFDNMMGDVVYIAGFYHQGKIVPASDPFILTSEGEVRMLNADNNMASLDTMRLERKYPYFNRMNTLATQLRSSIIEGADNSAFHKAVKLAGIDFTPRDTAEIRINCETAYRYLRCHIKDARLGNLAEISFWGIGKDGVERKLTGEIIGAPFAKDSPLPHPYTDAMDEDYNSYFSKLKNEDGYIGLDLGRGNTAKPTKVRLYPRSDTNYIIPSEEYELFYWKDGRWISHGRMVATCHHLDYRHVPAGTLYWLRDLTRGKEERIFTYEDGKQVWW